MMDPGKTLIINQIEKPDRIYNIGVTFATLIIGL